MYGISFDRNAKKSFDKLDNYNKIKVVRKVEKLKSSPFLGNPLSGSMFGIRSLRIDKLRALYKIVEDKLIIIDIDHRKNAYRK